SRLGSAFSLRLFMLKQVSQASLRQTPYLGRQAPVFRGEETPFRPHSRLRRRRRYAAPEAKEYASATVTFSHAAAYAPLRFSTPTPILRLARPVVAPIL